MAWDPIRDPINYYKLNNVRCPGVSLIGDPADAKRNWEQQKSMGFSGAFLRYTGDGLAEFSMTTYLWEPVQFDQWRDFAKMLLPAPTGKKPDALLIWHPLLVLEPNNITKVVVTSAPTPVGNQQSLYTFTTKFTQFRVPKAASAKPAKAPGAPEPTPEELAMFAQNQLNDALILQITTSAGRK